MIQFGPNKTKQFDHILTSEKVKENNISMKTLSEVLNIGESIIKYYLQGKAIPSKIAIYRLADAIGCNPNELIKEET